MTPPYAFGAALVLAGVLALLLARLGLAGRLFRDALAIGATLAATWMLLMAPFDGKASPFSPAIMAFLSAGAFEEAIKLVGVAVLLRGHFRVGDAHELTLAAGALGLGFGAVENFGYFPQAGAGWAGLALARGLTAQPFHLMLGLAGGYAVARAPRAWLAIWAALAVTHGLYEYGGSTAADGWLQDKASALGLDPVETSRALMTAAEAAAALAAALALHATNGRRSPALGWVDWGLAGTFGGGALVALFVGVLGAYAFDDGAVLGGVVAIATPPLAIGVLSVPKRPRFSRRVGGFAFAALALAGVVAAVWGPSGWAWLEESHAQSQGRRFASAGDYDRATGAFSRAIARAPGDVAPLAERAAAYAAQGRYETALVDLDAALRLQPASAALHAQRAGVNRRRDAAAAALADFDTVISLAPDDPTFLALRAQARLEAGDAKGAHDDLAEASRRAPDAALVRLIAADWELDTGDFDAALRDLNAVLHATPNDAEALFRRGRVWFYKDEPAKADADFARVGGSHAALWRWLAHSRLHAKDDVDLQMNPARWPAPVALMLMGEIDAAAARAAASDEGQRCEADFYYAASRLGLDASETSANRLRALLGECPPSHVEHEGAKALLRRLAL